MKMNVAHYLGQKLAMVLTIISMVGFANRSFAAEVPQAIHVLKVKGQARFSSDYKTWQALKAGAVLEAGTLIQTGEKSTVDLLLGDHDLPPGPAPAPIDPNANFPDAGLQKENVIHMTANSVLGIDKLTCVRTDADEKSETQLDLRDGQIIGRFGQTSAGSKFEIKFARGVAGVRQGVYAITSAGAVRVTSGAVVVAETLAGGDMVTKMVLPSQVFDPRTGLVAQVAPGEIQTPQSPMRGVSPPAMEKPPESGVPLRKF
jgi:hypothetical protein